MIHDGTAPEQDATQAEADLRATRAASRRWATAAYASVGVVLATTGTGVALRDPVTVVAGAALVPVALTSLLLAHRAQRRGAAQWPGGATGRGPAGPRPVLPRVASALITIGFLGLFLTLTWGWPWWIVAAVAAGWLLTAAVLGVAVGRAIHHRDAQGPGTDRTPGGSDEH